MAAMFGALLAWAMLVPAAAATKPARCLVTIPATHARYATLQSAVDAASPGAEILVKGTCVGTTTILKDVVVTGQANKGFGPATLDGNGEGPVVTIGTRFSSGLTVALTGLVIRNGVAPLGGGVSIPDLQSQIAVTVTGSVITGNRARDGGGFWNGPPGTLTLIDTVVSGNVASGAGGGYANGDGSLVAQGTTTFSGNAAGQDGGGVFQQAHGHATLADTVSVHHNTAAHFGGGVEAADASITLTGRASIHDNTAGDGGGGAFDGAGEIYLNGSSSITGNTAPIGAGILAMGPGGSVVMTGTSSIAGNTATQDGGGVWLWSTNQLRLSDSASITGNVAGGVGGGVFGQGATTFVYIATGASITDNTPDNCYPIGSVTHCTD